MSSPISNFVDKYFLHFNAAALVDAADEYHAQLAKGNKMMVTLAGAMSTAEMGKMLAEMIRQDKIHIISCTASKSRRRHHESGSTRSLRAYTKLPRPNSAAGTRIT